MILGDYYAVDRESVYVVNETRSAWVKMPTADRATFRVLGGQFARDRNQIFQKGTRVEGADLGSFSVISGQYGYAQDSSRVYGPNGVIQGADTETFKMLTKHYSIDAGRVYFDGNNIPEANSGSFLVIDDGLYAQDDDQVFYAGKVLEGVSPAGFVVRGPRAFAADGRTFFEGLIEKGDLPKDDEPTKPEPEKPGDKETARDAWEAFWEGFAPYTKYFTGENVTFWILMALAVLGAFSLFFVFFAARNDEPVSPLKSILKTLLACAIGVVCVWLASLFFKPVTALVVGLVIGFFFLVGLWSALGWIKSFLIAILTLIGIVFVTALAALVLRAIFGDLEGVLEFINRPEMQLLGLMKILGFFAGSWLIATQLGSTLGRSIGQAFVATAVSVGILGLMTWITDIGPILSVVIFTAVYAVILWIMRFRMVSDLFPETVRIVRVALILGAMIGIVAWIVL